MSETAEWRRWERINEDIERYKLPNLNNRDKLGLKKWTYP